MNPEPKLRAGIDRLSLTLALLLSALSTACAAPPHYVSVYENLIGVNDSLFAVLESASDNHGRHGYMTTALNFCVLRIDDRREVHRELVYRETHEWDSSHVEQPDMNLGGRLRQFGLIPPQASLNERFAQIEGKNLVIPDDAGTARRLISIEHLHYWFRHLEYRLTAYAPEQEGTDLRLQSTMENRRGDLFLTVERRLHDDPPVLVKVIPISCGFFDGVKVARNMVPLVLVAGEGKIAASIVQGGAKRA